MEERTFEETVRLVRATQDGDEAARGVLFSRYLPILRRIVATKMGKRLREIYEIDDIVQEALYEALRRLDSFEVRSEGSFRHWMASLVQNRLRDAARRVSAQKRGGGKERPFASYGTSVFSESRITGEDPTPSQEALGNETEERVEEALLQLRPRYREVYAYRHHYEMSYEEISERMGLAGAGPARCLYSRALNELSKRL